MHRRPLMAGNWKMYKTQAEAGGLRRLRRRSSRVSTTATSALRAVHRPGRAGRRDRRHERQVGAQTMHFAAEGAFTGEVSAAMLGRARRRRRRSSVTPSGASTSPRTTPTWPGRCAPRSTPVCCRCCAAARPRRARGRPTERRSAARSTPTWPTSGRRSCRGRGRLRTHLGDRHRQDGDLRDGPGDGRLHSLAASRARFGDGGRRGARPLRRQRQVDEHRRSDGAAGHRRRARRRRQPGPREFARIVASRRRDRRRDGRYAARERRANPATRPSRRRAALPAGRAGRSSTAGASRPPVSGNAISSPTRRLRPAARHATRTARSRPRDAAVGLPAGQMGNSEVGHLNIGAGRVVYQDLTRITKAIGDGDFFENPRAQARFRQGRRTRLHGPPAGPRLRWRCAQRHGTSRGVPGYGPREGAAACVVHAFLDGRDTLPDSASGYLAEIEAFMDATRRGPLRHGERALLRHGPRHALGPNQLAYDALVHGDGSVRLRRRQPSPPPTNAARPTSSCSRTRRSARGRRRASPPGDGDVCLFFNFRPDRVRQLTRAFFEKALRPLRPRSAPAARRFRHHDRVQEGVPAAGRLPARAPAARAGRGAGRARPAPAPYRRDREVRACHLLLQRRRRERGAGRDAHPRPEPARRADLRLQAADERPGGHRRVAAQLEPASSTSWSSISPTPTWSVTRGVSRRLSPRSRPWTPAWAGSSPRRSPGRRLPGHRRPRQLRPHARA